MTAVVPFHPQRSVKLAANNDLSVVMNGAEMVIIPSAKKRDIDMLMHALATLRVLIPDNGDNAL